LDHPAVSRHDFLQLDLRRDIDTAEPILVLHISQAASERLAAVTEMAIGRRLALVLDGRLMAAPIISASMRNVRLRLHFDPMLSAALSEADWALLGEALGHPPLKGEWKAMR